MLAVPLEESGPEFLAGDVKERLEEFVAGVVVASMDHPVQRENAQLYVRGLLAAGHRKSLEPLVVRLAGNGDYQSLQQFLADSPWDAGRVMRAVVERVAPALEAEAWVLDDTGFPKDGKHSPGVKRQYSGTLGKIGNCQIGVSVHAISEKGTLPLGWALYLPEEWCSDAERRRKAKIPEDVTFQTKPELGLRLIECAAGFQIECAPVLGDAAYGDNTRLRTVLNDQEIEYVLSISPDTTVFEPGTSLTGSRAKDKHKAVSIENLARSLREENFHTVTYRGEGKSRVRSRFAFVRIIAAHPVILDKQPPRDEWLIIEWPAGRSEPSDFWISNLPATAKPARLARLARLRWMIELDYKQLKGHLGLDHYEGRSYRGWYHHTALVTLAHAFLTLERQNTKVQQRASHYPKRSALFEPILDCWAGHCHTCHQPVDLTNLPLHRPPQNE